MTRIRPCGDDALRIEPADLHDRHDIALHLRACGTWPEVVTGRTTVTVQVDLARLGLDQARTLLDAQLAGVAPRATRATVPLVLPARFGGEAGPDLDDLAARTGMAAADIVRALCDSPLRVDLVGFTPGFAYLDGVDPALQAQRLATPRRRVAAGSIGLLTGQVGLYALAGPGGWPLVGRICRPLFDGAATPPFLLHTGQPVRLQAVDGP
ncbi:MAG: carboxyltransferase domain-containing protein [Pseudoxanthomonas sp.]|nr:carboxyltransferase domain-containing protein [Pseudoxanthomonas sp.]